MIGCMVTGERARHGRPDLPRWLQLSFTAFVAVLVPIYWREYGPANFLWFSDIALFAIVVGLWTGHPLPASMTAVGVLLLESVWILDFALLIVTGSSPVGLAEYMRDEDIPAGVRAVSLFHLVLPPLLLWMVHRLGYDRRAWLAETGLALVVLPVTYLVSPPEKNINWVFGPAGVQTWLPPLAWLGLLMVTLPLLVYWPTHRLLLWWSARQHP
jgi:hypothetical protein